MQVYIRPKKKLLGSSLAFNLKEGPVRCVKVCDKSWVILMGTLGLKKIGKLHWEGRESKRSALLAFSV
jgi:hypothetical protein